MGDSSINWWISYEFLQHMKNVGLAVTVRKAEAYLVHHSCGIFRSGEHTGTRRMKTVWEVC
jgi:predicted alpha/beta hydrolase family esterase